MRALYMPQLNKIELKDVEKPQLKNSTDVIIKVTSTTICGSDIHIVNGVIPTQPGFVLGHEYVGIIEEVGDDVKNFRVGDRVIGPPAPFCGECGPCQKGNVAHCLHGGIHGSGITRGDIPGTHAEYTRVPHGDSCLLHVPQHLSDEEVIFISDIVATGYTGIHKMNLQEGETLLVFGCGPVGLSAVLTAKFRKPKNIIVVEKSEQRLQKAMELGATHGLLVGRDNVEEEVAKITGGVGVDVVIDAVGLAITLEQGFNALTVEGRLFMVGIPEAPVAIHPLHFFKNITFSMGLGDLTKIEELLGYVANGELDLKPLISHQMSLDDVEAAFDLFANNPNEVLKIIIKP